MPLTGPYKTQAEALRACGSSSSSSSSSSRSTSTSTSSTSTSTPWWCVQVGDSVPTCQQSATEPGNTVGGPYTTQAECSEVCTGGGGTISCQHATGLCPETWTFTVTGIGGSYTVPSPCTSCTTDCTEYNGTFTMTRPFPGVLPCLWIVYTGGICDCPTDVLSAWQMSYDSDDGWRLEALGLNGVASGVGTVRLGKYVLDPDPENLNCEGCNTFLLNNSPNQCSGWPESITVCPGGGMGMAMAMTAPEPEQVKPKALTPREKYKQLVREINFRPKPCNCRKRNNV